MVPDVIGSVQTQLKRNEEQQDDNSFLQLGQILFQGFQYENAEYAGPVLRTSWRYTQSVAHD